MSSLRIALAQCRQTADLDTNAATIFRMIDEAAQQRVQVLCFAETQTVGYRVDIATPDQPVPVERLAEVHGRVAERCAWLGMACILGTEIPPELALAGRGAGRPDLGTDRAPAGGAPGGRPDVARSTRAMFEFERGGMADVLFRDTVRPEEFVAAGPMTS